MKAIVDANVLFSCLIKDSTAREIFFNPVLVLFAPEFIIKEFISHLREIQIKSGLSEKDFLTLADNAFSQIQLVKNAELKPFLPAAASLISDSKDWLYLACALKEDAVMWTNDKGFKAQARIRVLTTKEIISIVGSL